MHSSLRQQHRQPPAGVRLPRVSAVPHMPRAHLRHRRSPLKCSQSSGRQRQQGLVKRCHSRTGLRGRRRRQQWIVRVSLGSAAVAAMAAAVAAAPRRSAWRLPARSAAAAQQAAMFPSRSRSRTCAPASTAMSCRCSPFYPCNDGHRKQLLMGDCRRWRQHPSHGSNTLT